MTDEPIIQNIIFVLLCAFFVTVMLQILQGIAGGKYIDLFADEGRIALGTAYILKSHQVLISIIGWLGHEPLLPYYAFLPVFFLFGMNIIVIRTALLIMSFVVAVILYRAAHHRFGPWPALALFALLVTSPTYYLIFHYFIEHSFVPIFLAAAIYLYARYTIRRSDHFFYASMLCLGLSFSVKTMVLMVFVAILVAAIVLGEHRRLTKEQLRYGIISFFIGVFPGSISTNILNIFGRAASITTLLKDTSHPAIWGWTTGATQMIGAFSWVPFAYAAVVTGYLVYCRGARKRPVHDIQFFFIVNIILFLFYSIFTAKHNIYRYAMFMPFYYLGLISCLMMIKARTSRNACAIVIIVFSMCFGYAELKGQKYFYINPTDSYSRKVLDYFAAYPPGHSIAFDHGHRWNQVYWYYATHGLALFDHRSFPALTLGWRGYQRNNTTITPLSRPLFDDGMYPDQRATPQRSIIHSISSVLERDIPPTVNVYQQLLDDGVEHYFFGNDPYFWARGEREKFQSGLITFLRKNRVPFTVRSCQFTSGGMKATMVDIR